MFWLLTLACSPLDPDDTGSTTSPTSMETGDTGDTDEPTPWVFDDSAPPEAAYGPEAIGHALQAFVDTAFDLHPIPLLGAFEAVMAEAGTTCPTLLQDGVYPLWYEPDGCIAETGAAFDGYAYYLTGDIEEGDYLYDGQYISGEATMTSAVGDTLLVAGSAYLVHGDSLRAEEDPQFHHLYQSRVSGAFDWSGPEATGTWLEDDASPDLTVAAYRYPNIGDGRAVTITGSVSGLDTEIDTVWFDEMTLIEASLGSDCSQEPSGIVAVRDPSGAWYDVLFDGPTEDLEVVAPDACDGCGDAWFRGVEVGEVCVDFTPLFAWSGDSPWS